MDYKKIRVNTLKGININSRLIVYFVMAALLYEEVIYSNISFITFPLNSLGVSFLSIALCFYSLNIVRGKTLTNKPFLDLFNVRNFGKYLTTWITDIILYGVISFIVTIPILIYGGINLFKNTNFDYTLIEEAEQLAYTNDYMAILQNPQMRDLLTDFSVLIYAGLIIMYFLTIYKKYIYLIAYDSNVDAKSSDIIKLSFYFHIKNIFRFLLIDFVFVIIVFLSSDIQYLYLLETGELLTQFYLPFSIVACITNVVRNVVYAGFYEELVRLNADKPLVKKVIKPEVLEQLVNAEKPPINLDPQSSDFSI